MPEKTMIGGIPIDSVPLEDGAPVFDEPWQAQVFALTVSLHRQGLFTWTEWAGMLSSELAMAGPADTASNYYRHWLAALERLLAKRNIASAQSLMETAEQWKRAAEATPHGQPIVLAAGKSRTRRNPA